MTEFWISIGQCRNFVYSLFFFWGGRGVAWKWGVIMDWQLTQLMEKENDISLIIYWLRRKIKNSRDFSLVKPFLIFNLFWIFQRIFVNFRPHIWCKLKQSVSSESPWFTDQKIFSFPERVNCKEDFSACCWGVGTWTHNFLILSILKTTQKDH